MMEEGRVSESMSVFKVTRKDQERNIPRAPFHGYGISWRP